MKKNNDANKLPEAVQVVHKGSKLHSNLAETAATLSALRAKFYEQTCFDAIGKPRPTNRKERRHLRAYIRRAYSQLRKKESNKQRAEKNQRR